MRFTQIIIEIYNEGTHTKLKGFHMKHLGGKKLGVLWNVPKKTRDLKEISNVLESRKAIQNHNIIQVLFSK